MTPGEIILQLCDKVFARYMDSICWYHLEVSDDSKGLVVHFLPCPDYDVGAIHKLMQLVVCILNTAVDNDIFEKCDLNAINVPYTRIF